MNIRDRYGFMDRMLPYAMIASAPTGPQSEEKKRKEGRTCPMPKSKQRFPRK